MSNPLKNTYERFRPLIIWLGLIELAWIAYWLLSAGQFSTLYFKVIIFWVVMLLVWAVLVANLGLRGVYLKHTKYFSNLIGFIFVLLFTAALFVFVPAVREGVAFAVKYIPDTHLAGIHILRLLAMGTIIKYFQRELPLHFLTLGSLPDFIFALSAVFITLLVGEGVVSEDYLRLWHIMGCVVFLGAGLSMFFSMPSFLRITHTKPDTTIVFEFPMLMAPNFTVPLFIVAHAIALVKLWPA